MSDSNQPSQPTLTPSSLRGLGLWALLLGGLSLVLSVAQHGGFAGDPTDVSFTEFKNEVAAGKIGEVTLSDHNVTGTERDQSAKGQKKRVQAVLPPGDITKDLLAFLEANKVSVSGVQPSQWLPALWTILFILPIVFLGFAMFRRANPQQQTLSFSKSPARQHLDSDVKTTFNDVAGIDELRDELQELVDYLREPEKFRRLGGRIPRGVLLVGAPGTGKTLLAKALAGEAHVPFFSMSGSDFVELFVGVGASRVRDLFREASEVAGQQGCVIFIDELDALGKARGNSLLGGAHDEREQTLNQLLVEMDGFDTRANIIVLGATNRPEILDPALLRPGRFDRQVMIPAPDVKGREAILKVHVRDVKVDPSVSLRRLAARTPGFVGADLANMVNEAALLAARKNHETVLFEDFDEAIDRVSMGISRHSQLLTGDQKRAVAIHELGHAVVAAFCPHSDPIQKITIVPRGQAEGMVMLAADNDRKLQTEAELHDRMATALGGRSAEELMLELVSVGAANDIQQVTRVARAMVIELGMSEKLGPLNYDVPVRVDAFGFPLTGGIKLSDETTQRIDAEVKRLVDEAHARAQVILSEHRDLLLKLADRLVVDETLDRPQVYELLGLPEPPEPQIDDEPEDNPRPAQNETPNA